jgi:hypothetical protein
MSKRVKVAIRWRGRIFTKEYGHYRLMETISKSFDKVSPTIVLAKMESDFELGLLEFGYFHEKDSRFSQDKRRYLESNQYRDQVEQDKKVEQKLKTINRNNAKKKKKPL